MNLLNRKILVSFVTTIFFTFGFVIFCCNEKVSAGDISESVYISMLTVGVPSGNSEGDFNSSHNAAVRHPGVLLVAGNDSVRAVFTKCRLISLFYFKYDFFFRYIGQGG